MSIVALPAQVATATIPTSQRSSLNVADEKTEAFEQQLKQCGYQSLQHIEVIVRDGLVELHGTVGSYAMKQLAQETIRPLAIGIEIKNEVRVY